MRALTGTQGKALICAYLDRIARDNLDTGVRRMQRPLTQRVLVELQSQFPCIYAVCLVEPARFTLQVKQQAEIVATCH